MSSPVESIGVLRELPCIKNDIVPVVFEHLKSHVDDYPDQPSRKESQKPGLTEKTLDLLLGASRKKAKKKPSLTAKSLENKMNKFFKENPLNVAVIESASISKMLALACLANGNELEACCHLIASHATCLRQQILYRNLKNKIKRDVLKQPMVETLDPKDLDIDHCNENTNPKTLVSTLKELPTEWYMIQITAEHEHINNIRHRTQRQDSVYSLKPMHALHLIVLPTGKNATEPICITLPKPNSDSNYDIRLEIERLLNNNKSDLTAAYGNNDLYWKMRKKQNESMISAITELEFSWLREWRVLLLADYMENLDLVKDIHSMIDKLIADSSIKDIKESTRWLLKKIAVGACYLQPFEIERAVKYLLPKQMKLAKNLILSIVVKSKVMEPLKFAKRKSLILILDECLDHIAFESINLLKHQPVTRCPSLHIAYALFKQHRSTIKDGFKIIRPSEKLGTFIVNPSLDLMKMETRMRLFIEYWLPKWKGSYGLKPDSDTFKAALTEHEILMYNGHGSGIQFFSGLEIERLRILASVLLFGCSSIKLIPVGGRLPAYGISNQYLMGCSPCILGMLWEVTDGDIDKMTTEFMSSWVPSSAKRPWSDVNKTSWINGSIEFNKGACGKKLETEQNMLVAVSKSKDICKQYMTSAAIVVRGLPIKLVD